MDTLRALLVADPTLSYSALIERLVEAGGTRIGKTCMIRAVKKLGLKRTRLPVAAKPKPAPGPRRFKQPREEWKPRTGVRGHYPSDLTDKEWAVIEPLLPALKDGGRHFKWSRRELLDGILYVLRTGCQWRALPHDLPPWKTVYGTFRAWRRDGTWERLNDSLRRHLRLASQRNEDATVWIIDSQSVRTTEKGGSVDMTRANE
jgi:transposase